MYDSGQKERHMKALIAEKFESITVADDGDSVSYTQGLVTWRILVVKRMGHWDLYLAMTADQKAEDAPLDPDGYFNHKHSTYDRAVAKAVSYFMTTSLR